MDVTVTSEVSFGRKVIRMTRRAITHLGMQDSLLGLHIDIMSPLKHPRTLYNDSVENRANNRACFHLRLNHFVHSPYRKLPLKEIPADAFLLQRSRAVVYRLLVQLRDCQQCGIPEDQDEQFLHLWNAYVAGRISQLGVDLFDEGDYWTEFDRLFTAGRFVAEADMIFQALWTRDDLVFADLYRFRAQLRELALALAKKR